MHAAVDPTYRRRGRGRDPKACGGTPNRRKAQYIPQREQREQKRPHVLKLGIALPLPPLSLFKIKKGFCEKLEVASLNTSFAPKRGCQ